MAKRTAGRSTSDMATSDTKVAATKRIDVLAMRGADREEIKVNNASLTELKNACDDAIRTLLSHKDLFTTIHTHEDVKLALGWSSVMIAGATAFYGYKTEFEESKPIMWVGVILYVILSTTQTLYTWFIERDMVYVGTRKALAGRIETERVTISSRTVPSEPQRPPQYHLTIRYVRSTNGGTTLLGRGSVEAKKGYNEFFDEEGKLDQDRFDRWLGDLVEEVMEEK